MRIQHNIMAMNAYRNYMNNTSALSRNLEKLSSGYRINRAGDDAAGLAISEKMRAQITGLDAAQQNVSDGVNLVKTAEGAMQEVQDMLNRMVYLATQSANGTYDEEVDRANLQKEIDSLSDEIDRIADSANFNGIKLLDGSLSEKLADGAAVTAELLSAQSVDGMDPTAATKATLTGVGAAAPTAESLIASTTNGTTATAGSKASLALAFADTGDKVTINGNDITNATTIADLGAMVIADGVTFADVFDQTDWTASGAIGDSFTLTAKAAGALNANVAAALSGATLTDDAATADSVSSTFTDGGDIGAGGAGNKFDVTYTFDLTNATGGEVFRIGDKSFIFDNDGTVADGSQDSDGNYVIDLAGSTDAEIAASIQKAFEAAFGTTDYTITTTDATTNTENLLAETFKVQVSAKQGGSQYNLGDISSDDVSSSVPISAGTVTLGTDGAGGGIGSVATASYKVTAEDLGVGAQLTIGGVNVKIVADDDATAGTVTGGNTYNLAVSNVDEAGLKNALQQAGFAYDHVTWDGTTLTVASNQAPDSDAAAKTSGTEFATSLGATLTPAATGTAVGTNYKDLYNQSVTVNGVTFKAGELFDITYTADGSTTATAIATDTTGTIAAGDTIAYTAKATGKLDESMLQSIANKFGLSYTNGLDEGEGADSGATKYTMSLDLANIAGGQTFELNGTTYELSMNGQASDGNTVVDLSRYTNDIEGNAEKVLKEIVDTIKASDSTVASNFTITSDKKSTITLEANSVSTDTNFGAIEIGHNDPNAADAITATYSASTGVANPAKGVIASNTYSINRSDLQVGDTITIGSTTVEIVEDADADVAAGKFSLTQAADDVALNTYFNNALANSNTDAVAGSALSGAKVMFNGDTVRVSAMEADDVTAAEHAAKFGVSATGTRDTETMVGGLTLQIGDTSDEYNQLTVSIEDMHVASLGIGDVDISTQEGAAAAVDKIKAAINSVSMTRGTLGATQNRLEHTANNLSVMEENITDAESSIRDTDIAEEMMAYTKNNILIQSAQAMLAQANAVPQGVLQLLQ